MEFIPGYRAANAPKRPAKKAPAPAPSAEHAAPSGEQAASEKKPNGHGPRLDTSGAKPFDYGSGLEQQLETAHSPKFQAPESDAASTPSAPNLRLAIVTDPLSQQGTEMQADAPACDVCGSITVRSGTCYKCLNCGNSMGCS